MIRIAGDDDVASLPGSAFSKVLHASDKRTRGVDNLSRARFQVALNLRSDAVSANDGDRVAIGFFGSINRGDALRAEPLHLLRVVNQRAERPNRTCALLDCFFDHLDGAFDAETESVLLCQ